MEERIIRAKIDAVGAMAIVGRWPIGGWQARTADNPAPGEYRFHGDWAPVPDESFWQPGATLFLRVEAQVPGAARDTTLYVAFDILHLEGLLSIDGDPWQGIDAQHPRAALPVSRAGARSGRVDLALEFSCVPAAVHEPALRRERARFRDARLEAVDRETEALWYDLRFAAEAVQAVKDERRRQLLAAALEDALLAIDLQADDAAWPGIVRESRALLAGRLAAIAPDPEGGPRLPDRPLPHRHRLALAAARDGAQVRPHLLHRLPADGALTPTTTSRAASRSSTPTPSDTTPPSTRRSKRWVSEGPLGDHRRHVGRVGLQRALRARR